MMFDKDEVLDTLAVKANEKIEEMRHEIAQAMFDSLSEEAFYVYSKKGDEVVAGPFDSKQRAERERAQGDKHDLIVMTERDIQNKLGL